MIKFLLKKLSLIFLIFCLQNFLYCLEQKIVVITASYNNARFINIPGKGQMRTCQWNLSTIFNQNYSNYEIRYRDDNSNDGTDVYVQDFVTENNMWSKVKFVRNNQNLGALQNQYEEIMSCDDNDIIVIVDGDDGIAHKDVFKFLNNVYSDPKIWLTYGQYRELHSCNIGFCCPMPYDVVRNNAFRGYSNIPSHLRTCRAWLFKKIQKEHLMLDGKFLRMTGDMATWIPMIEMASCGHFKFIPEVLLTYNDTNPISDHHKDVGMQRRIDRYVRSLPVYNPL